MGLIKEIIQFIKYNQQRVCFINNGREGEVIYKEGFLKQIRFYVALGGNEVALYISIPIASDWERTTSFPLKRRNEILEFVALNTQKYQAPSCRYEIYDNSILFKTNYGQITGLQRGLL